MPERRRFVIGLQDTVVTTNREFIARLVKPDSVTVAPDALEYRSRSRLGKELDRCRFICIG